MAKREAIVDKYLYSIKSVRLMRGVARISTLALLQSRTWIQFLHTDCPRFRISVDVRIPPFLSFDGNFHGLERITFGARAMMFVLSAPGSCRNMNRCGGMGQDRPGAWRPSLKSRIFTFRIGHARVSLARR